MGRYALALLLLWLGTATAFMRNTCYPAEQMRDHMLAEGKVPFYEGWEQGRYPIGILVNPETREWTMLRKWKHGDVDYLCFMESAEGPLQGEGWSSRSSAKTGKPL